MNPYATHKPAEGGLYLKLKDGEIKTIRLASPPYIFQSKFERGDEVSWSTRYAWVIFNVDEQIAQVLQLSATTYRDIAALALDEEYGDPTQYNIKLKRNGSGTDTTYSVIASPKKEPLPASAQEKVDKINLNEVKGLEHALPLTQVTDGSNAPKPEEDPTVTADTNLSEKQVQDFFDQPPADQLKEPF